MKYVNGQLFSEGKEFVNECLTNQSNVDRNFKHFHIQNE